MTTSPALMTAAAVTAAAVIAAGLTAATAVTAAAVTKGQAMGLSGISKSKVSKLCKEIDERVHAFLDRPLAGEWLYLGLDATYPKQREGGRISAAMFSTKWLNE